MTDSSGVDGVEHFLAIGSVFFTLTVGLLAWASGSKEGKQIADADEINSKTSAVATAVGGATGAGLIDLSSYQALIGGLDEVTQHLNRMDTKLGRLVELGESQDEREERLRQHHDIRDMIQSMVNDLKVDIANGNERRTTANRKQTTQTKNIYDTDRP